MMIDNKKKIFIFSFFQVLFLFTAKHIISPLIPLISEELGVGLDYMGLAISLSIFAMFFISLITGNLIEIMGLKNVLFIGLLVNLSGSVMLFSSHTFLVFAIGYFAMQLGTSILWVCKLSIVGTFFPKNKAVRLLQINFGGALGFIVAPLLVSFILFLDIDWRYYYIIHPVIIMLLTISLWKIDIPRKLKVESNFKKLFTENKRIIKNPVFILCIVIIFFFASSSNIFFVWFTSYFNSLDVNLDISSLYLTVYGAALFLGMVLRNQLVRRFKRKQILLTGFVISFFLLISILLTGNLVAKIILIFLFGISISGNLSITFSISSDIFPEYDHSLSGFNLAAANLGTMVFQYLSGYMTEYYSRNSVIYIDIGILFVLIIATGLLNFHKKFSTINC
jgi:predicted MFS family arabinose efflux permease